jgi:hypothetical protein
VPTAWICSPYRPCEQIIRSAGCTAAKCSNIRAPRFESLSELSHVAAAASGPSQWRTLPLATRWLPDTLPRRHHGGRGHTGQDHRYVEVAADVVAGP